MSGSMLIVILAAALIVFYLLVDKLTESKYDKEKVGSIKITVGDKVFEV